MRKFITVFFILVAQLSFAQNLPGDNLVGNLKKIEINPKTKAIDYIFKKANKTKKIRYIFGSNNASIEFHGDVKQTVTVNRDGKLVFKHGKNSKQYNLSQRKVLFSKLNPEFMTLLKRNYVNSNLGIPMIRTANTPEAIAFEASDLPLVRLLDIIIDLAEGTGNCEEQKSCSCFIDNKSDTTTCPCGSLVRCREESYMVCYWDATGLAQSCESETTCTAICMVPEE